MHQAAAIKLRQRRTKVVLFLFVVLSIWCSFIFIQCFPLSKLVVTGERYYTTDDDIHKSIIALGSLGTFITQDVNVIKQQIELLPWIKQVIVRKHWPDKLQIHLLEYVPVAYWNDLQMLDKNSQTFIVPPDRNRIGQKFIPMFYGPEGSEQEVLADYLTMNEMLTDDQVQLKAVSMSARHSWQLTLTLQQDDIRLELGRENLVNRVRRLQRFIDIYPFLIQQARKDSRRIKYVDLRYNSGIAVGWDS